MSGTKYRVYYGINSEGRFAADIAAAESRCFSEPWSESAVRDFFAYSYNGAVISCTDGVFSGYITYTFIAGELQIANVCVLPEFRRRGIADGLMAAFVAFAKEQKAEKISLEVRASNEPASALYEKWGFKAVGLRRNFYKAPTEDAVLYDKILEQ